MSVAAVVVKQRTILATIMNDTDGANLNTSRATRAAAWVTSHDSKHTKKNPTELTRRCFLAGCRGVGIRLTFCKNPGSFPSDARAWSIPWVIEQENDDMEKFFRLVTQIRKEQYVVS